MSDANTGEYLGLDFGGTKLLVGTMKSDGTLGPTKKYPTGSISQKEAFTLINEAIDQYIKENDKSNLRAIGIGLVGRVDNKNGIWKSLDNCNSNEFDFSSYVEEKYKIPCFLDNDVRSATKAEKTFGQGKSSRQFTYINVGTGIAAGIINEGSLIRGTCFNAGEVGHTSSGLNLNVKCVCGRTDCVEAIASGMGIDKCARLFKKDFPNTSLIIPEDGSRVDASMVFSLSKEDELCAFLAENAAKALANLIMNMVRFSDPELIVMGGGILTNSDFFEKVVSLVDDYTVRFVTKGIRLTGLDCSHIGLIGACCNAIEGINKSNYKG